VNTTLTDSERAVTASIRLGIIGGGQLGLMLGEAARAMGFKRVTVLDATPDCPASLVAEQIAGSLKDPAALRELAAQSDILTYEIEHINTDALKELEREGKAIYPAPASLEIIQDKLAQKQFLAARGIPVAPFLPVHTQADIEQAIERWGYPLVLKARRDAYDGRGNARLNGPEDIESALDKLGGRDLYVERGLDLAKELGVMVARNLRGETAAHPVVEMLHARDICETVLAPAQIADAQREEVTAIALKAISTLEGAGIFGVEMFLDSAGSIWLNEIAPRPHNSGHYSIEACQTSQFEQHLRAIANLPPGSTAMLYPAAVMVNILGTRNGPAHPVWSRDYTSQHVFVHLYGKRETRVDRKMGHITTVGDTLEEAYRLACEARESLTI
jgi:5-(carboxyamino)imidazole ribonucleotide synthase